MNLKTVLPKLQQPVKFPTRGANLLDLDYTNTKHAYKAELGLSDHTTVMLTALLRRAKTEPKLVKTWLEVAIEAV